MKKVFIIPGFKQSASSKQFFWLKRYLVKKGFDVSVVSITWERRTMADYAKEFEDFYRKNALHDNYVLGFSYGAVIAFITANKLKPKKVFLCSLSPDFKEDIPHMKKWVLNYIGKKRIAEIAIRNGKRIARELTIPAVIFYGEKEGMQYPQMKIRCKETARLAKNAKVIIVKDAPHDTTHPNYKAAIKSEL